jgi:YspA, cpYpsA-related SLOG family
MKLIVAGSRTFTDYQRLCQVLAPDRHRITQIFTGGARGAELLGYRWAWKHAIRHQLFRADWERFGKSAGVRRNYQMAQAGDVLIAFWDGQSSDTAHMVQCMRQLGKPVVVIRVETTADKKRLDTCPGASPEFASLATAHELYLNPLRQKGVQHGNDRITSATLRTSPGSCGAHRLRRRGDGSCTSTLRIIRSARASGNISPFHY